MPKISFEWWKMIERVNGIYYYNNTKEKGDFDLAELFQNDKLFRYLITYNHINMI